MKLTKFGHACVRLEKDDRVLVIDPGIFSDTRALDGAHSVLITHEHFDHMDHDALARLPGDVEIWTCEGAAAKLAGVSAKIQVVRDGDAFETAGFRVRTVGEWHAPNHPDQPIVQNIGFLVNDDVFYPGDALTRPGVEVGTLMVPTGAPWLKLPEVIAYLRDVRPERAFSTHDALYSDAGLMLVDSWLLAEADRQKADMRRLAVGESVTLA
ncbi:MBL fold metallo-hydrolase [Microtetraspora sp. NBRC 13810]|uniref:MBL fold metallo-hydrolase n=1 Tax=Microtetraspora sp. NBRC 13810 TaxID=3030990 RepID=UPI0024A23814|nr:MBL fold metallo-hydrolase [Microtetraspora sp. NBRC 13810]GLW06154.1 MBL fold metallo-hydrolase [Microtetraspora sp. NBRC 13810]